jgi:WD40 repeat protein/serine/threonine protein kinase
MTRCPSSEELQRWLADGLCGPEADAVEAHVEACAACQQRLEELTGNAARTALEPNGRDESGGDFLRRLEQSPPAGADLPPGPTGKAAPAASSPAAEAPAVAGYDILGLLGRGGMGVVYQARHLGLNRLVALKMVLAGVHADAGQLARFRGEAEAVARLQHPHIVQIYEVGEQDGRPFLALEYLSGGSLAEKLAGTPQPPRAAAELVETLARAVQAAHDKGVIHRDLKPANVLLTEDGTPKIADFGLAKRLDAEAGQTQSGAVLGTPSYMAPEQAAGKGKAVGPAADVYALGAILYELLTGRPPFKGATPLETLQQVVAEEPVPPRRLSPQVPPDLETVCLKCLHKEPHRRYPSAVELAEDLRRFLEDRPTLARPVGFWQRGVKWARRRPALAALTGVSGLAVLILVLGSLWHTVQLSGALHTAEQRREEAERQRARADGNLYIAHMNLAQAAWDNAQVGHVLELLNRHGEPRPDATDLRGWEWFYQRRLCQGELRTCRGHTASVLGVAYSPDGRRLASAAKDGTVKVWDAATGEALRTLQAHTGEARSVAFSPDGRRVASAGSDQTLKVWDADSGQLVLTFTGHTGPVEGVAFSPDGRRLASASWDRTVKVWDAKGGPALLTFRGVVEGQFLSVAFGPDGQQLAAGHQDGSLQVWDVASRGRLHTFRNRVGDYPGSLYWSIAFSPDGRRLSAANQDGTIQLWDATTGREVYTIQGHTQPVTGVAFSPDGQRLASASQDQTVKVWDTSSGQEVRTLKGGRYAVLQVAFHPDGRRVAAANRFQPVKVWDARDLTAELAVEREAHGLVQFLFARPLRRAAVIESLGNNQTITDAVRRQALALAEGAPEERVAARYHDASRALVRHPRLNTFQYQVALWQAEAACQLGPDVRSYRTTLGGAQYRLGRFEDACRPLLEADPADPVTLAFLAMTRQRGGEPEKARDTLGQLRELMKQDRWRRDAEAAAILVEAEALLQGAKP